MLYTATNQPIIKNAKGEPIVLNARQLAIADMVQRQMNALGYEVPITTLTAITARVTTAKYFQVNPSDYVPVVVGNGAWSTNITTYRSFDAADEFENGIIDTGGQNARLAAADAAVDSMNIKVFNWAKSFGWSIPDLEMSARSGNWDLVAAKAAAAKRNWDIGVQRTAFLGMRGQNAANGACMGLLNQAGVTIDTQTLPAPLSSLGPSDFNQFLSQIVQAYRANNNYTADADRFIIPESDFNGLVSQMSSDFPIKTKLEVLQQALAVGFQNPNFKVMRLSYADAANHADCPTIVGKQVYTLTRYDEESIRMDIPVPFTTTLANSIDNFNYQCAVYGQVTGVLAYRPLETYYLQF